MESQISEIKNTFFKKVSKAQNLKELDEIFLELFGKKGQITLLPKGFSRLPKNQLKVTSPLFNQTKQELEKTINNKRITIKEESYKKLADEELTITPGGCEAKNRQGHLHPITKLEWDTIKLFNKLGFKLYEAPHIDTDEYNFELLNIPKGHAARDLWDSLYLNTEGLKANPGELLLRTHTSNGQVRAMRELKLPIRVMIIDRCFRYENLDARHEHTFEQFELVYVDKGASMANLQYLSEYFFKAILGKDIKARLRPKYFPFVEPGAGVDGLCIFCKGKGCKVCGGVGWLELAGAGMIHPQVLKNGGVDPDTYSGIAWGFGPERMAMLKYGIEDIRLFKSGYLKFLERIDHESK